ncbi:MAG: hypothetical protein FJ276_32150 [Planctomycetes bacterium]|nr:hypothetical protein [Planctomycetota bacterium]
MVGGICRRIVEDEEAVWIEESGQRAAVERTRAAVKLPTFAGHRHAQVLRVLHQELLINVTQKLSAPHTWHAAEVLLYLLSDPQFRSPIPTGS